MRFLTRAMAGAALGLSGVGLPARANPTGPTVVVGSATVSSAGSTLTVNSGSAATVLSWQSFNVGPGQKTVFNEPSASSVVWNQVTGGSPSQIFGSIQANGLLVIANSSGIWFGPNSVVKTAGFVATTASAPPADFAAGGGAWNLNIAPPTASIINYGQIQAAKGGSIFLVAEKIENHGVLTAPDGTLGLYAGKEVQISDRPDGRGLTATVKLPEGSVDNFGRLIADAGQIALQAQVVNQSGYVQANSVEEHEGVIEFVATQSVALGANSQTIAQGDPSQSSPGGQIVIQSGGSYQDAPTAVVNASGSAKGGAGGSINLSAVEFSSLNAQVAARGGPGSPNGSLVIDPTTITIDVPSNGGTAAASGTISVGDPGAPIIDPATLTGFSQITLEASQKISVNAPLALGDATTATSITLRSGGDIQFGDQGSLSVGHGWSIVLVAGASFASPTAVLPGVGSILLGPSSETTSGASISAIDGSISLFAGKDIVVQLGSITTTGGGSITANAGGSINTGSGTVGYLFGQPAPGPGYIVNSGLSGISTAAGGDVTLTAGGNIISYLPTGSSGDLGDAGSGAFGGGNVTVNAGGNVTGHYVIASGVGAITAGMAAGTTSSQLALSLITGSWNVQANLITLQEVRNPNGIFNSGTGPSDPKKFFFDYDASDSVTLNANTVVLLGGNLPRVNSNEPIFYPGTLTIEAGSGGVALGSSVTLLPAPLGQLSIATTQGGDFYSLFGNAYTLAMSDSGATRYTGKKGGQFGTGEHATVPVHENDPNPVSIHISGDLDDIALFMPKATSLTVDGDINDSSLLTQNLHPTDVTSITVGGSIKNINQYTSYALTQADVDLIETYPLSKGQTTPNLSDLMFADPALAAQISFDPKLGSYGTIFVSGKLTQSDVNQLSNLFVYERDRQGNPIPINPNSTIPLLDPNPLGPVLPPDILSLMLVGSQSSGVSPSQGFQVGGPGKFTISAKNIDLGSTPGIVVNGGGYNSNIYKYLDGTLHEGISLGADISVTTTGDLTMYSSAIESIGGGSLSVTVGGVLTVGSTGVQSAADFIARGIFTGGGGSVTVTVDNNESALNAISVNGSHIATYDGGDLTISARQGNVDAGTGGLSVQSVTEYVVNPTTGSVKGNSDIIPGSGILATTFSYGNAIVGNIDVTAPYGNIIAIGGGLIQAPFNGTSALNSSITLDAGTKPTATDPGFIGEVNATGSVVAGGNVSVSATGPIYGTFLASGNLGITTPQSVNVTALAGGAANVSGGSVGGTIIGGSSVTVGSSGSISANLVSSTVATGGSETSGQTGLGTGNTAGAAGAAAAATTTVADKPLAKLDEDAEDPRKKSKAALFRTEKRVTVVLPGKAN